MGTEDRFTGKSGQLTTTLLIIVKKVVVVGLSRIKNAHIGRFYMAAIDLLGGH
jgi:hypothetical protein